jgi:hypothetical protein
LSEYRLRYTQIESCPTRRKKKVECERERKTMKRKHLLIIHDPVLSALKSQLVTEKDPAKRFDLWLRYETQKSILELFGIKLRWNRKKDEVTQIVEIPNKKRFGIKA